MAKTPTSAPGKAPSKVKLKHPETGDEHEFTLEHAQRIFDYQAKRVKLGADKAWTLVEGQDYKLKDGKIISGTTSGDSK